MQRLAAGDRIALCSDAGTPLVSDPGARLVAAALAQGARVFPLPGASAVLAAVVAAGLPSDRFLFAGFPPPKGAARDRFFAELAPVPAALVFFEGQGNTAAVFVVIAALTVIGIIAYYAVVLAERRVLHYLPSAQRHG
jgi:16S rRNA (cytidine1402-2'-O)-methyltransferase